jgi:hypothetical protein
LRTRFSTLGRAALLIAALLVASAAAGVESASAAWSKVAFWEMNEPAGATTMTDSSGHGRSGHIGDSITTGVVVNGANKAYQWPADPGNRDIEHLVIADRPATNPYRYAFSVFVRFKSNTADANIVQKGQSTTPGGMWKVEVTGGRVICTFKGPAGRAAIGSRHALDLSNWHTVRCIRRLSGATIVVDGGFPRKQSGSTGRIANNSAVTIGGKKDCNPPAVSCQYYEGLVDRITIRRT